MTDDPGVTGAGDVLVPGCSLKEAIESGASAGSGQNAGSEPMVAQAVSLGTSGYVCLCEDVSAKDLRQAWDEGWHSSEILKRYTTATMGPCQGALCGGYLSDFTARMHAGEGSGAPAQAPASSRTTARPPARPVALEVLAAGVSEVIQKRT